MSSRFRNGSSAKTSFFAFQDIITSVSGILILIVLILSLDLNKLASSSSEGVATPAPELEARLTAMLIEQSRLELRLDELRQTLADTRSAVTAETLEKEIANMQARIRTEQGKAEEQARRTASQNEAIRQQDAALGLNSVRDTIEKARRDAEELAVKEKAVRQSLAELAGAVRQAQDRVLTAKSTAGQVWLIPSPTATSKEPILLLTGRSSVVAERFDRPDLRASFSSPSVVSEFNRYLDRASAQNQYLVFYVRPSGIGIFEELAKVAKQKGFEIGFDALEEDRQVHFSKPPGDAPSATAHQPVPPTAPAATPKTNPVPNAPPATPAVPPVPIPVAKPLTWWQKLIQQLGF